MSMSMSMSMLPDGAVFVCLVQYRKSAVIANRILFAFFTLLDPIIITGSRLHANTRIVCLKLQGEVGVLPYNRFLKQMAMFWKINV